MSLPTLPTPDRPGSDLAPDELPALLQTTDSPTVARIGYLRGAEVLFVELRSNGALYAYWNIPSQHWKRMRQAVSLDRYLQRHIYRRYRAVRVMAGE